MGWSLVPIVDVLTSTIHAYRFNICFSQVSHCCTNIIILRFQTRTHTYYDLQFTNHAFILVHICKNNIYRRGWPRNANKIYYLQYSLGIAIMLNLGSNHTGCTHSSRRIHILRFYAYSRTIVLLYIYIYVVAQNSQVQRATILCVLVAFTIAQANNHFALQSKCVQKH